MDPSTHYHYLKKREVGIDEANTVEHFMKEFGRGTEMDGPLVTQWTLVMNFLIALLGEGYYEERGPRGRHGRSSSTYLGLPACLPACLVGYTASNCAVSKTTLSQKEETSKTASGLSTMRARCDPMQEVDAGRRDGVGSRSG